MIYCPECKLDVDDRDCVDTCPKCGNVIQQSNVDDGVTWERGRANHFQSNSKKKGSRNGLFVGQKILENLFHKYNTPDSLRTTVMEMFKKTFESRKFRSAENKKISAACCLFIAMRANNQPAVRSSFCCQVDCTAQKFNSICHKTQIVLETSIKHQKVEDLVPVILCNFPEQERATLIRKTQVLARLCDECWITTGKSAESVVVAAAFCCYRSIHPKDCMSIEKFMDSFKLWGPQVKSRVAEMKEFIFKLAKSIDDYHLFDKRNVFIVLDYVLDNSSSLRKELFNKSGSEELESFEFKSYRKPIKQRSCAVKDSGEMSMEDYDSSDSDISKYVLTEEEAQNLDFFSKIAEEEDSKEGDEM